MSFTEKRVYYYAIKERYKKASKMEKSIILKEFCIVCGYNKKYAIRILNQPDKVNIKKRAGKKKKYFSPEFLEAIKKIWSSTDYICSKRLKVAIPLWLPYYESIFGALSIETQDQLVAISPASIDRLLKSARLKRKKGLSGTKPGTLLKNQIPIRDNNWDIDKPGFMEADTVAHCGNSLSGDFIWSLTMTDIFTGWTENRAVWNKGSIGVVKQIQDIENSLPFELKGFDCDNGSEFLNYHLLKYFSENGKNTKFTRSRPNKKNDNAHVEQKNWTQVRNLFGYDRLEDESLVDLMNSLYSNEWMLYNNYFRPSQKLVDKVKINSKYIRKYDIPKTPYMRIMESEFVSIEKKKELEMTFKSLNPFTLKKIIDQKLRDIFKNVTVTSNLRQRI